jgi:hypothetical protein
MESDKEIKVSALMKRFMGSLKLSVGDYKRKRANPNCKTIS